MAENKHLPGRGTMAGGRPAFTPLPRKVLDQPFYGWGFVASSSIRAKADSEAR